jgi:protein-arginine kinase activator protein McsA
MKNTNYNLVKLLLRKLDDIWRMEKFYVKDSKAHSCKDCHAILKKVIALDKQGAEMLREELARHIKDKDFE